MADIVGVRTVDLRARVLLLNQTAFTVSWTSIPESTAECSVS